MPTPLLRRSAFRRAFAISAVVLATGGLVLFKSPAAANLPHIGTTSTGKSTASFQGPGAHGTVALSHSRVLAGQSGSMYAEIKLRADESKAARARAPLSLAIVLDTSGSMQGEKLEDAKRSALRLVDDMQPDDQIAFVRYSDSAETLQPLARVGDVRASLKARIEELRAGGGTNIPSGLERGSRALSESLGGRVRRIVLVSDGLDSTRVQAEGLARSSFASGVTVSSLGIGLDFDEAYLGGVAQNGHGNFAFIKDGGSLATFLARELHETAATTLEDARVELTLPDGIRFVSVTGAEATHENGRLTLRLGSVFSGDERRVLVELVNDGRAEADVVARASWHLIGGDSTSLTAAPLHVGLAASVSDVEVDPAVLASATSVLASKRQIEAADAYSKGDVARAAALAAQNQAELGRAMQAAPAVAPALRAQAEAYGEQKKSFESIAPSSTKGKALGKSARGADVDNLNRASKF